MRILPLLAIVVLAHGADEPAATTLPPAAAAVLDKFAKSEERLTLDHKQALIAERTKAIDALGKVLKDITKTGDLDAANAVKARIDDLRERNAEDMPTDLLGNAKAADPSKLIVGEWSFTKTTGLTGMITASADGVAIANVGQIAVSGRWEVVKDATTKARRIRLVWMGDQGRWEEVAFVDPDRADGDSSDAGKDGISLRRKKK